MEKPDNCKMCGNDSLIHHTTRLVFNPETDEDEEIADVYECTNCDSLFYEQDGRPAVHMTRIPGGKSYTTRF